MKYCAWQEPDDYCQSYVEGRTDYCARHNRLMRKAEESAKRNAENLARKLLKASEKAKEPRAKVNPVSDKRKEQNKEYAKISEDFKRGNPSCAARINGYCTGKTESVHHKRGRGKYLLDVSTFFPCCLSCHSYIEAHPEEAKERGWSESRLAIDQTKPTI